ncbi:tRNA glutamyl-Q(34) synthetase GluQRS [Oleiharenicola sp. Vm1]|uniref:tRNA glutamyl-Q(34) synthetase GluQRS n=1 Tax=Oleiharenicola sp. Vm1 TaxID=3398393 RepID=UPI0039F5261B
MVEKNPSYRGRLAPSPTGYLHLGHARTFWIAHQRALAAGGALILRNDDLDAARCRPEFVAAMLEDLAWFGFRWSEGPDVGGPHAPYDQSRRHAHYAAAFDRLRAAGAIYPCTCSRKDVQAAASAPHESPAAPGVGDEPHYPGTCRPDHLAPAERIRRATLPRAGVNWRFRVPEGETLAFADGHFGPQHAVAGREIADFLVWRRDDTPSYQLACTVDDAAMGITEVVRGADLIRSTFRQLLLYRTLGAAAPAFFHCPLVTDEHGVRLAKRHDALSLRALRAAGRTPAALRAGW